MESASTRVTVDNTPPEIRLTAPLQAETFSASTDVIVTLASEVFDTGDIDRVEFYINQLDGEETDIRLGEATAFPYNFTWAIDSERGARTLWAIVYDKAGNATESNRVLVTLAD